MTSIIKERQYSYDFEMIIYTTPLGRAVSQDGRVDEVRSLIAAGSDVNLAECTIRTPLQIALRYATEDLLEYVTLLLGAGASINFPNSTPLIDLICRQARRQLLKLPTKINTLLCVAQKLIDAGCDVNQLCTLRAMDNCGYSLTQTALMQAVECDLVEFVEFFLDAGADPNIKCDEYSVSLTPLHMAAHHQNIPVAKLLIKANCDLHAVSTTIPESEINSDGIGPIARIVSIVPHGFTPLGVTCWKEEPSVEFGLLLLEAAAKAEKNVAFRRPLLCVPIKRRNEELGSNPSTLQCLAVNAVRSCLRGPHYRRKIASLELPHTVVLDLEFGNIK